MHLVNKTEDNKNMKQRKLLIIISICAFLCGCGNSTEEFNTIMVTPVTCDLSDETVDEMKECKKLVEYDFDGMHYVTMGTDYVKFCDDTKALEDLLKVEILAPKDFESEFLVKMYEHGGSINALSEVQQFDEVNYSVYVYMVESLNGSTTTFNQEGTYRNEEITINDIKAKLYSSPDKTSIIYSYGDANYVWELETDDNEIINNFIASF